jgi:16S rRNA (cytosine1402-N4)-methyltransferase
MTESTSTHDTPIFEHVSVLSQELIAGLQLQPGGHYLDATVGGGGHSALILASYPDIRLTAIDRDANALAAAQVTLASFGERVQFWQGSFADFDPGEILFDGIIADLGVSSAQLDQPERGFSFRFDAPLDMRMDQSQTLTAAELVNTDSERELADIFYHVGEERFARRIARQVVAKRPLHTTGELAAIVSRSQPQRPHQRGKSRHGQGIHPATRVFQALRIAVNQELLSLEVLIQRAPSWLKPSGKLGIISFHSLEDRRVKHGLREHPLLQVITRKPIGPGEAEITANPRARSAKLRFAERLPQ